MLTGRILDALEYPGIYGHVSHRVDFEVLGLPSKLVQGGSHIRIVQPFIWK